MPPGLSHLTTPGNVESGVKDHFFFAPASWFEILHCPPEDGIVIPYEHKFNAGKNWIKVLVSPNTGDVSASTIGEQGSKKFLKKHKGFVPGTKDTLHATMSGLVNEAIVLRIPDSDCPSGYSYQLGCDCVYAYCESAEFTTGTQKDGHKGYQVEFHYPTDKVVLYPTCENITPTFTWAFNNNGNGECPMQVVNTTVMPAGVTATKAFTIFDDLGNEFTTAPFQSSYVHDTTSPDLWDQILGPTGGNYYWIITMVLTCSNGCIRTAKATLDGNTIVGDVCVNGDPHNGTQD